MPLNKRYASMNIGYFICSVLLLLFFFNNNNIVMSNEIITASTTPWNIASQTFNITFSDFTPTSVINQSEYEVSIDLQFLFQVSRLSHSEVFHLINYEFIYDDDSIRVVSSPLFINRDHPKITTTVSFPDNPLSDNVKNTNKKGTDVTTPSIISSRITFALQPNTWTNQGEASGIPWSITNKNTGEVIENTLDVVPSRMFSTNDKFISFSKDPAMIPTQDDGVIRFVLDFTSIKSPLNEPYTLRVNGDEISSRDYPNNRGIISTVSPPSPSSSSSSSSLSTYLCTVTDLTNTKSFDIVAEPYVDEFYGYSIIFPFNNQDMTIPEQSDVRIQCPEMFIQPLTTTHLTTKLTWSWSPYLPEQYPYRQERFMSWYTMDTTFESYFPIEKINVDFQVEDLGQSITSDLFTVRLVTQFPINDGFDWVLDQLHIFPVHPGSNPIVINQFPGASKTKLLLKLTYDDNSVEYVDLTKDRDIHWIKSVPTGATTWIFVLSRPFHFSLSPTPPIQGGKKNTLSAPNAQLTNVQITLSFPIMIGYTDTITFKHHLFFHPLDLPQKIYQYETDHEVLIESVVPISSTIDITHIPSELDHGDYEAYTFLFTMTTSKAISQPYIMYINGTRSYNFNGGFSLHTDSSDTTTKTTTCQVDVAHSTHVLIFHVPITLDPIHNSTIFHFDEDKFKIPAESTLYTRCGKNVRVFVDSHDDPRYLYPHFWEFRPYNNQDVIVDDMIALPFGFCTPQALFKYSNHEPVPFEYHYSHNLMGKYPQVLRQNFTFVPFENTTSDVELVYEFKIVEYQIPTALVTADYTALSNNIYCVMTVYNDVNASSVIIHPCEFARVVVQTDILLLQNAYISIALPWSSASLSKINLEIHVPITEAFVTPEDSSQPQYEIKIQPRMFPSTLPAPTYRSVNVKPVSKLPEYANTQFKMDKVTAVTDAMPNLWYVNIIFNDIVSLEFTQDAIVYPNIPLSVDSSTKKVPFQHLPSFDSNDCYISWLGHDERARSHPVKFQIESNTGLILKFQSSPVTIKANDLAPGSPNVTLKCQSVGFYTGFDTTRLIDVPIQWTIQTYYKQTNPDISLSPILLPSILSDRFNVYSSSSITPPVTNDYVMTNFNVFATMLPHGYSSVPWILTISSVPIPPQISDGGKDLTNIESITYTFSTISISGVDCTLHPHYFHGSTLTMWLRFDMSSVQFSHEIKLGPMLQQDVNNHCVGRGITITVTKDQVPQSLESVVGVRFEFSIALLQVTGSLIGVDFTLFEPITNKSYQPIQTPSFPSTIPLFSDFTFSYRPTGATTNDNISASDDDDDGGVDHLNNSLSNVSAHQTVSFVIRLQLKDKAIYDPIIISTNTTHTLFPIFEMVQTDIREPCHIAIELPNKKTLTSMITPHLLDGKAAVMFPLPTDRAEFPPFSTITVDCTRSDIIIQFDESTSVYNEPIAMVATLGALPNQIRIIDSKMLYAATTLMPAASSFRIPTSFTPTLLSPLTTYSPSLHFEVDGFPLVDEHLTTNKFHLFAGIRNVALNITSASHILKIRSYCRYDNDPTGRNIILENINNFSIPSTQGYDKEVWFSNTISFPVCSQKKAVTSLYKRTVVFDMVMFNILSGTTVPEFQLLLQSSSLYDSNVYVSSQHTAIPPTTLLTEEPPQMSYYNITKADVTAILHSRKHRKNMFDNGMSGHINDDNTANIMSKFIRGFSPIIIESLTQDLNTPITLFSNATRFIPPVQQVNAVNIDNHHERIATTPHHSFFELIPNHKKECIVTNYPNTKVKYGKIIPMQSKFNTTITFDLANIDIARIPISSGLRIDCPHWVVIAPRGSRTLPLSYSIATLNVTDIDSNIGKIKAISWVMQPMGGGHDDDIVPDEKTNNTFRNIMIAVIVIGVVIAVVIIGFSIFKARNSLGKKKQPLLNDDDLNLSAEV